MPAPQQYTQPHSFSPYGPHGNALDPHVKTPVRPADTFAWPGQPYAMATPPAYCHHSPQLLPPTTNQWYNSSVHHARQLWPQPLYEVPGNTCYEHSSDCPWPWPTPARVRPTASYPTAFTLAQACDPDYRPATLQAIPGLHVEPHQHDAQEHTQFSWVPLQVSSAHQDLDETATPPRTSKTWPGKLTALKSKAIIRSLEKQAEMLTSSPGLPDARDNVCQDDGYALERLSGETDSLNLGGEEIQPSAIEVDSNVSQYCENWS